MAMRALMEVLQGGEEGNEEEKSGPREGGVGEVGGSVEERDVLLQALGSVRYAHSSQIPVGWGTGHSGCKRHALDSPPT